MLAVLGAFYVLDKEITLLVVTALLTLAGYSLTDTVVVFDRIRENLARRRGKLAEIINLSINEVLSRTIITSLTVVLVLVPLVIFGGEVRGAYRLGDGPGDELLDPEVIESGLSEMMVSLIGISWMMHSIAGGWPTDEMHHSALYWR